jgi:hypothetical protein
LTIKNQSKLSCHTIYRKNVSTDYVPTNLNFTTMQLSKNKIIRLRFRLRFRRFLNLNLGLSLLIFWWR